MLRRALAYDFIMNARPRKSAAKRASKRKSTTNSAQQSRFIERDTSWLNFNRRVLEEACDPSNPLLERVKFLAITASNLDEFVEIRVASLLQRIEDGLNDRGPDGKTAEETLRSISEQMHELVRGQYRTWNKQLLPALKESGIRLLTWTEMSEEAREYASRFYQSEVDPLLTPITIDPSHPFPRVLNKALCLALLLQRKRKSTAGHVLGVLTVPRALPRLVPLPSAPGKTDYIFLHTLIEQHVPAMYRGYEILSSAAFRVTRNSNLYMQEEEARSVLESVRTELHNRRKGDAVRLEIECEADPEIINRLQSNFELYDAQVFRTEGPVNLSRLMTLYSNTPRADLKYPPFTPRELKLNKGCSDLFDELRRHDLMFHHPYDSYNAVEQFIEAGAKDPNVVSMKQTLYRTSENSSIFQALIEAAQTKEVTVVVELMARFDEASNIRWARNLEDAGVQVFHGLVGLKTHAKLALLVRRDADGVTRRYAHLGTGNYNPITARFYTDISLLTADPQITAAVHAVFNFLTAHSETEDHSPLMLAPVHLAAQTIALIDRETTHARAGRPARIIAKMNSLLEPSIVAALYNASQAGVEVDCIIRGICALRPGVHGLSENIRVRSILGRFLEHSRIFAFENGGNQEIYCGSADWMPRNLFERCEVVFPVGDPGLRARLSNEILAAYLADNTKAWLLQPDGQYIRTKPGQAVPFSAQEFLIRLAEGKALAAEIPPLPQPRRPTPLESVVPPPSIAAIAEHSLAE